MGNAHLLGTCLMNGVTPYSKKLAGALTLVSGCIMLVNGIHVFVSLIFIGQPFYYRGCGWSPKYMAWMNNGKTWVQMISQLFDSSFGPDFCQYEYTKSKHCVLVPGQFPLFSYDHVQWEKDYPVRGSADDTVKV